MLREEIPRGPSKRDQTDWQMRSKKGQRLGDAYYTVYRAPVESRNQGLDHEGGWKQIHTSWFPVQWGTVPTFRLYLVCIFCTHTFHCNQKAFGLTTCKLHAKEMKSGNIALFRPSVPPNSSTTRQKTHCWIPALTIVFPHKIDAS